MKKGHYLFTSESVSKGHPDKVADQISDALLDEFLKQDRDSHVACETFCTTGLVVVGGEVTTDGYVDVQKTVRDTINKIGYTKGEYMFSGDSCGVISTLHEQSPDINQGVVRKRAEDQGAGDQGIMFGYATNETKEYMPMTWVVANGLLQTLDRMRESGEISYLRPDAKSQVTIEYDENNRPVRVDTIVVSTQHDDLVKEGKCGSDEEMLKLIATDIEQKVIPEYLNTCEKSIADVFHNSDIKIYVNPTGKFVIGGPHGDTGLTGRKIIVDTYGGWGAHGGGAFSGKDPSKVDRSAAYKARHVAKNLVAAGLCERCLIQLSYAIGMAQPVSVYVNTYGTHRADLTDQMISEMITSVVDFTPYAIIAQFGLKNPIYKATAAYGHFGHDCYTQDGIEYFGWEKLSCVGLFQKLCPSK